MEIERIRVSKNMTQEQVGQSVGVSRSTVAMWETGKTKPKADTLLALSALFNCSIDELLGNERVG